MPAMQSTTEGNQPETQASARTPDAELMGRLQSILLKDDRAALSQLQDILNTRDKLSDKISPIIEDHIEFLRKNFPKEYGAVVNRMIEQKIKYSQTEILDVIYPVIGTMIKKYVALQFQQLKDAIDARIKAQFSRKGFIGYIRYRLFGISPGEITLADMDKPLTEEIFIIQRDSGLILGTASLFPTDNREAVAGMLTAVKAFAEDAFGREKEELETVQYGTYRILLNNFPFYYFAVALSGSVSWEEDERLRGEIVDFIRQTTELHNITEDYAFTDVVSQKLERSFILPQKEQLNQLPINKGQLHKS